MKYNCYKHAKLSNKRHDFNIPTIPHKNLRYNHRNYNCIKKQLSC